MRLAPRTLLCLAAAGSLLACGKGETFGLEPGDDSGFGAPDGNSNDAGFLPDGFVPILDAAPGPVDADVDSGPGLFDAFVEDVGPGDVPFFPDTGPGTDGGLDAGLDTGVISDGGTPDATPNDGGAPQCTSDNDCGIFGVFGHCDPNSLTCVQCYEDTHCPGNGVCDLAGGNICRRACNNGNCFGGNVCDPSINACVECLTDGDCDGGEVCNPSNHSCNECASNADCALNPGQAICDPSGSCVGCASDGDCGPGESCNSTQGGFCAAPSGRGLCEACLVDDECGGPNDLCVGYVGNNGIFDRSCSTDCSNGNACPSGYECVSVRQGQGQVCRPRNGMQTPTCTALRNLGESCLFDPGVSDPGCGLPGVNDARCFASTTTPGVCTYFCQDVADCPSGTTCQQIGNQGYCL